MKNSIDIPAPLDGSLFSKVLLDALPCSVIVTDRRGRTLWVNRGFHEMCGYSFTDVHGRTPGEILQGPATDKQTIRQMREAMLRGDGFSVRLLNYDKRGRSYWVSLDVAPFEADGQEGFVGIARDLTEGLKASPRLEETAGELPHMTRAVGHLAAAANEDIELHQFYLSLADAIASLGGGRG